MRCQRHDLIALTVKEGVGADDERTNPLLDQGCKGAVDFAFGAGVQDTDLQAESSGCRLQVFRYDPDVRIGRVDEQGQSCWPQALAHARGPAASPPPMR